MSTKKCKATVFCLGHRLSKQNLTSCAKNLRRGDGPLLPPQATSMHHLELLRQAQEKDGNAGH